jgi:hypothetical protein
MRSVFWLEYLNGSDHSEDLSVDGKIMLERILEEIGLNNVDWMHVAEDRVNWRDLVKTLMNRRVP